MGWVVFYTLLLLSFVAISVYSASVHETSIWLKAIIGVTPTLTALGQALSRTNLRFYLITQRVWLRFHQDQTTMWRFTVRIDGDLGDDIILRFEERIKKNLHAWKPEIQARTPTSLRLKVDQTIHLHAQMTSEEFSEDGFSHLLIRSDEIEITYASAREKIDRCIVPLMTAFARQWPLATFSTIFEAEFKKKNPFFAFYVAHLSKEQVTSFNLVFRPESVTREENDLVAVTQQSLRVEASSPESFAQLSKAFILMTSEVAQFTES